MLCSRCKLLCARFSDILVYSCHWYGIFFTISPDFVPHLHCVKIILNTRKNTEAVIFFLFFYFQSLLAEMYYYGKRGLQRDLNRAVKYYQMGADKGDPEGLYNLGISKLRVRKTAIEC